MVELFRNPKLDWIAAKKYFIGLTIALLVAGAISVQIRGFNLGVDFTGGTIMTVRFKEPRKAEEIRSVLASSDIDTSKITIVNDKNRPTDMLIRAPELGNEAERRVDETKRQISKGLQKLNASGEVAAGKVNINGIDADGIDQELRQADPLNIANQTFAGAHPYHQIAEQVIAFRDGPQKGFISDLESLRGLAINVSGIGESDVSKVKDVILNRFYTGKIDLNLAGQSEIESALKRIDPLGIGGQSDAGDVYRKAAEAIRKYRTDRSGVINNLDEIQVQDVSADLLAKMEPYFTTGNWAVISADIVGPQVGVDLRNRAIYVTLAALAGMLIYVAFRFEWIYGVAAVLAVFHDIMITLGIFSLLRQEISLTVIAALLTLVGYSMNDTIVVFDRIRENVRLRRRDSLVQITNDAINQTLSRTVIAAGLTFISVLAILLFGGQVLRGFALALTIGILIGTYSSIAVASPIMLWWQYFTGGKDKQGRGRAVAAVGQKPGQTRAERTLAKV
jgi:preprotein translocase SecF subunit